MAINPYLMLSGIGIMAMAVFAVFYWKRITGAKKEFFLAGAGFWLVSLAAKLLLDLTVTLSVRQWLVSSTGLAAILAVGLYAGLRTGLLESGLGYVVVLKTWLRKMKFRDAVAFAVGFGSLEAFLIGLTFFANILIFVLMPEIIATVPAAYQAALIEQLGASTLFIIPDIIRYAAMIVIYVFSFVLVIYAVRSKDLRYLWCSIIFKIVVDGVVPVLVYMSGLATSLAGAYMIEIPFIALAAVGFYGTRWLSGKKW